MIIIVILLFTPPPSPPGVSTGYHSCFLPLVSLRSPENIFDHFPVVQGVTLQAGGKPDFLQLDDCVFQALKGEVRTET